MLTTVETFSPKTPESIPGKTKRSTLAVGYAYSTTEIVSSVSPSASHLIHKHKKQ
jgi:hypothetical protein